MSINLPGASGSKAQIVAPYGTVSATVTVTMLVTPCSWMSLSTPGGCSEMPGVIWAISHGGCLLGAVTAVVAVRGHWLRPAPVKVTSSGRPATSEVTDSHLVPQRSLVWTCSLRSGFLVPGPTESLT